MDRKVIKKELLQLLNYFPAVALIGARQVGKTTLAKDIVKDLSVPAIYLDLEWPPDNRKLDDEGYFLSTHQNKLIILDEIQFAPNLFPSIRALIDQNRKPCRFLILGSATPKLLRQSSESLAGRIAYMELNPFTLDELEAIPMEKHWFRGGFPDAVLAPNDTISELWKKNFIKATIERDLAILGLDLEPLFLFRLLRIISSAHGSNLNVNNFAKALGVTTPTVSRYLDFLEGAFFIRRLPPYYTNMKKRLLKSPKIYIRDSGILHKLLEINSFFDLQDNQMVGNSWEGYVIQQLLSHLKNENQAFYFKTQDDAEIDLVILRGTEPHWVFEIKYSLAPKLSRGNTEAMNTLKAKHNFIVCPMKESGYALKNGVKIIGLLEAIDIIKAI